MFNRNTKMTISPPITSTLRIAPKRTLLPLVFVQVALDMDEDKALELIEDGWLYPAWNIGIGNDRRLIRFWRESLLAYQPGQRPAKVPLADVIAAAMPAYLAHAKEPKMIRGPELKTRLSCAASHIVHLIRAGELKAATKPNRNAAPVIFFASVVDFLKRREL
jgi:hypothetical protein